MAESFFATLECELLDRTTLSTHAEARAALVEFIEGWYITRRCHSVPSHRSPLEFERIHEVGSVDGARPNILPAGLSWVGSYSRAFGRTIRIPSQACGCQDCFVIVNLTS